MPKTVCLVQHFKDLSEDILNILVVLDSPISYLSQFADWYVPIEIRTGLWSRIMDFCGTDAPENMLRAEIEEVGRHYVEVVAEVDYLQRLYGYVVVHILCVILYVDTFVKT